MNVNFSIWYWVLIYMWRHRSGSKHFCKRFQFGTMVFYTLDCYESFVQPKLTSLLKKKLYKWLIAWSKTTIYMLCGIYVWPLILNIGQSFFLKKDPKIFLYEYSIGFLDYIVHCFVICKNTAGGGKYWVFWWFLCTLERSV